MKRTYLLIVGILMLIVLLSGCSNNQVVNEEVVAKYEFFDSFDNNDHGWLERDDENSKLIIQDGSYFIQSKLSDRLIQTQHSYEFEANKVYGTEASIKFVEGDSNSSYGMFVRNEAGEDIIFEINNNNQIRLINTLGNKSGVLLPWTDTAIALEGEFNQFDFLYDGSKGIFFLNKVNVASFEVADAKITHIGFVIRGKIKVEVDYIQLGEAKI